MKPKLLIIELWGVGDLAIATPFIRKASEHFDVTLLAKPFALDLQERFWPDIQIIPFNAPWTAFKSKYRLLSWPWKQIISCWHHLYKEKFDVALSARWDPRDHFLLQFTHARTRMGFPRVGSQVFLTHPLKAPPPEEHRYENWRVIADALKLGLPPRKQLNFSRANASSRTILIHTGAAQAVRVWPLENYRAVLHKLRAKGQDVKIVCNPDQIDWWKNAGEKEPACPRSIRDLLALLDSAAIFIGNDSGPGHLAASCGLSTFTFFGPQVADWFVPLDPAAEYVEGKACPYKPCSDYCRFAVPHCLWNVTEAEAWPRLEHFVNQQLNKALSKTSPSTLLNQLP